MARWPGTCGRGSPCLRPPRLAGLAVGPVAAAVRAVLHQLEPVRVVPPVLAGDVVAVLALLAGQGDLGPHIGGSHEGVPFSFDGPRPQVGSGVPGGRPPGPTLRAWAQPRSGKRTRPHRRSGGRT